MVWFRQQKGNVRFRGEADLKNARNHDSEGPVSAQSGRRSLQVQVSVDQSVDNF
ncbi:protein of unknown function [uncultured Woeseiaceae bacterium]|uniref:Uncharacterized protein n=1 Tax=uncultured Woeseiaceae bacterium TaxID=1983305 RepID=A0A7D9H6B9_9GAMM|nr:protein of unknown function [uncultured Woeseiaceae bacterium]